MMVTSYFLFNIDGIVIDETAVALIGVIIAVAGIIANFVITALNATHYEEKRQQVRLNHETKYQDNIRKEEKAALREALYTEIAWRVITLYNIAKMTKPNNPKSWNWLIDAFSRGSPDTRSPVYDSARQNTPALFYQLDDARDVDHFYISLEEIRRELDELNDAKGAAPSTMTRDELLTTVRAHLDNAIVQLDVDMLKKIINRVVKDKPDRLVGVSQTIQQIFDGLDDRFSYTNKKRRDEEKT